MIDSIIIVIISSSSSSSSSSSYFTYQIVHYQSIIVIIIIISSSSSSSIYLYSHKTCLDFSMCACRHTVQTSLRICLSHIAIYYYPDYCHYYYPSMIFFCRTVILFCRLLLLVAFSQDSFTILMFTLRITYVKSMMKVQRKMCLTNEIGTPEPNQSPR